MRICGRGQFKVLFSTLCIFCTTVLVVYWFYKFEIEDRDIGVVDFVPLNEAQDVKIPLLAICFSQFIVINSLKKANPAITPQNFHDFLSGNIWEQQSMNISFDNVTIDFKDYFINGFISDMLGNETRLNSSELKHKNVFTGFHKHSIFMKCFATSIEKTNPDIEIKEIHLVYDKHRLLNDLGIPRDKSLPMFSTIFYPEQMFLEVEPMRTTYIQSNMEGLFVNVHGIEMLMRRNSRHKKCFENSEFYDDNLLRTHVENVGCRPFYLSGFDEIPVCKNQKDIENSHINMFGIRKNHFPKACKRIGRINDEVNPVIDNRARGYLVFSVIYPNDIKIITQSKEIDVHTLIGNIGGYIGLFLGCSLIQISDLIISTYDLVIRKFRSKKARKEKNRTTTRASARIKFECSGKKRNHSCRCRQSPRMKINKNMDDMAIGLPDVDSIQPSELENCST